MTMERRNWAHSPTEYEPRVPDGRNAGMYYPTCWIRAMSHPKRQGYNRRHAGNGELYRGLEYRWWLQPEQTLPGCGSFLTRSNVAQIWQTNLWGCIMLYVIGFIALVIVITVIRSNRQSAKLREARREYEENEYAVGREKARAQCKHAYIQFSQTGVPGVITLTTKWCRVCGADLGPAKLKESIFGNHWE